MGIGLCSTHRAGSSKPPYHSLHVYPMPHLSPDSRTLGGLCGEIMPKTASIPRVGTDGASPGFFSHPTTSLLQARQKETISVNVSKQHHNQHHNHNTTTTTSLRFLTPLHSSPAPFPCLPIKKPNMRAYSPLFVLVLALLAAATQAFMVPRAPLPFSNTPTTAAKHRTREVCACMYVWVGVGVYVFLPALFSPEAQPLPPPLPSCVRVCLCEHSFSLPPCLLEAHPFLPPSLPSSSH